MEHEIEATLRWIQGLKIALADAERALGELQNGPNAGSRTTEDMSRLINEKIQMVKDSVQAFELGLLT